MKFSVKPMAFLAILLIGLFSLAAYGQGQPTQQGPNNLLTQPVQQALNDLRTLPAQQESTVLVAQQGPIVRIAVAANFDAPVHELINTYILTHPNVNFNVTVGATGNFLSEIIAAGVGNSPYDLFIAANTAAPSQLKSDGYAAANDNVTNYADGTLSLYANVAGGVELDDDTEQAEELLKDHSFTGYLVVADVEKAPYGAASKQVLLYDDINARDQYVESDGSMNTDNVDVEPDIGAAFDKVDSDSPTYPLGFIARSEICKIEGSLAGRFWTVPSSRYGIVLLQAALVLSSTHPATDTAAARDFLTYITTDADARAIITSYCYSLPLTH